MNTILVNKEIINLNNEEASLDIKVSNLTINISGKVILNDINNSLLNLIINLNNNSSLIYNKYNQNIKATHIIISTQNNTKILFNQSLFNKIVGTYEIYENILGSNNQIKVNIHGLTKDNGKLTITATGNINKNIKDNELLENVRILTLNNEENTIIPNLLVSSAEVIATHNATLSSVDNNYLFYLQSKGLSYENSIKLITSGFLLNNLNLDEEIKKQISI